MKEIDWTYMDLERKTLAKAIVDLQYKKSPKLKEYGLKGYKKSIEDAELNLQYLFNAYRYQMPELFLHYVDWVQTLFNSIELPENTLKDFLILTQTVLNLSVENKKLEAYIVNDLNILLDSSLLHMEVPKQDNGSPRIQDPKIEAYYTAYSSLVFDGKRDGLRKLFAKMQEEQVSIEVIYSEILEPFQRSLGDLWHLRKINVAQEHFATAMSQYAMTLLYDQIFNTPRVNRLMLSGCVEGELHEFGIRMISDYFEYCGWDTQFYGANIPPSALLSAISTHNPDVIILSCTMPYHLEKLEQLITQIKALQMNIPIFVGGYALDYLPDVWKKINADVYTSNFREALKHANKICNVEKEITYALNT